MWGTGPCSMSTLKGPLYNTARIEPPFILDHGRSSCIHGTYYTSYRLLCQVFILSHLLFFENKNKFFYRYTVRALPALLNMRSHWVRLSIPGLLHVMSIRLVQQGASDMMCTCAVQKRPERRMRF